MKKLLIIYGLPGAGKTSLCRGVVDKNSKIKYINIGEHADFRKEKTIDIIKKEFDVNSDIIIEGCFDSYGFRKSICEQFKKTHSATVIFLHEDLGVLASRRNRSIADYKKLLLNIQIAKENESERFLKEKDFQKRIDYILNIFNKKTSVVFGVTTYNRLPFFKKCIETWDNNRRRDNVWHLIISDDGSTDGTIEYINSLHFDGVEIHKIFNNRNGVHVGINKILSLSNTIDFDYGFRCEDDVFFKKPGWDDLYINAMRITGFSHLVFRDATWAKWRKTYFDGVEGGDGLLCCCGEKKDTQGAFWTFTKKIIKEIGYVDIENFGLCGLGHTDYTYRCARCGFNDNDYIYDIKDSNSYMELIKEGYYAAPNQNRLKLNTHKILKKKIEILNMPHRKYIPSIEPIIDLNLRTING